MFQFTPIGVIRSCFREKFGIPRQPGLAPAARATLELSPPYGQAAAVRGLEAFSHHGWCSCFTARRPAAGSRRYGRHAWAAIGGWGVRHPLHLPSQPHRAIGGPAGTGGHRRSTGDTAPCGVDLLDGTPVLDIKPYLPYADCLPEATGGFATEAPPHLPVEFSPAAAAFCATWPTDELHGLIVQILRQDPRPAYRGTSAAPQRYGMRLYDCDVHWEMRDGVAYVTEIQSDLEPR